MIAQVYELWEARVCGKCGGFTKLQREALHHEQATVWACQNGHREYVNIVIDPAYQPRLGPPVQPGGRRSTYSERAEQGYQYKGRREHGRRMAASLVRQRGRFVGRPKSGVV